MSFFNDDKDQPIDYTNKYNENIGSISPKSNNYDSHLTSYHSNNLFRSDDYSSFNQPIEQFNNQQQFNQQHFNQQQQFNQQHQFNNQQQHFNNQQHSNKVLDNDCIKNNYSFLFQDTTDCVTIYQTEDSPIIYSNDSPLSSLSLEFLPNLNPNDNLLNNKQFINNDNNQLNSSSDSIQNYNMEGTPIIYSYDSPLSPLSLNTSFDDCNLSSFDLNSRMNSIKELKNKKDSDLKSMISIMSIDKSKQSSINSSTNKLNKISFGQLDNNEYCELDLQQQINSNQFNKGQFNQITPNFLNNLVNQSNNQESQQNYRKTSKSIDFEDGFEEYDNEQFYLNKCISAGRQTNNQNRNSDQFNSHQQQIDNQINQQQQLTLNEIQSINHHSESSYNHQEQLNREEIPYYKINAKGSLNKKDLIKQINQKQLNASNQQFINNQQKQDKFKHPCSVDMGYYSNIDKDTDSSAITNFTQKYGSRSKYPIDGQADKREQSLHNARIPIPNLSQQFNQQQDEELFSQKQRLQEQSFQDSSLDNSPKQVKKKSIKRYLGFNIFNSKK